MEFNTLKEIYLSTYFLIHFKDVINENIVNSYLSFLNTIVQDKDVETILINYNLFLTNLKNKDLSIHVKNLVLKVKLSENNNIENEIDIINKLISVKFEDIKNILKNKYIDFSTLFEKMPAFINSAVCINTGEITFENEIKKDCLYSRTFIFERDLTLRPVENSETLTFKDLKGYKKQQKVLYQNTKALLENRKVNNILLYGDAGCGKSTSVRALLNEFKDIKIVQIFKNNLINLDRLYLKLKKLPYKFIIFADDISFNDSDETFSTLKAILEGSLIQCPKNAVIYATSNRRHLIRENFKSRKGDEIHLNDTINELNSLSDRFGINLLFQKPTNEEFNNIVLELAKDNNIKTDEETLLAKAQRLALIKGSKSPRVARQLIDNLIANIDI